MYAVMWVEMLIFVMLLGCNRVPRWTVTALVHTLVRFRSYLYFVLAFVLLTFVSTLYELNALESKLLEDGRMHLDQHLMHQSRVFRVERNVYLTFCSIILAVAIARMSYLYRHSTEGKKTEWEEPCDTSEKKNI